MSEPQPIVITRSTVRRAWSDFEPKLAAGLASGTVAAIILSVLGSFHINVDANTKEIVTLLCVLLAGYLTPSPGTTITNTIPATGEVVSRSDTGNTLTTITAGIPIQQPAPVTPPKVKSIGDMVRDSPANVAPEGATEVIPPGVNGGTW